MEGSEYNDGTAGADIKDNKVAPDTSYKYIWTVPDRAGPGPNDTNCVTWAYYSDVSSTHVQVSQWTGPQLFAKPFYPSLHEL